MSVDVTTETVIARPIADVWAYASDPTTAPQWHANIDRVGPDELSFGEVDAASTRMTLHNHGEPRRFGAIAAPALAMAMRRANRADLSRIRATLERGTDGGMR